jgi:integrase
VNHHRENPVRRVNAKGVVSWYARYTDRQGRRRSAGTFPLKREAQEAIDRAHGRVSIPDTIGAYFETWLTRHPRSEQTNKTNSDRIRAILGVQIERLPLRDWVFDDLRRRHVNLLVDHLLRVDGRAVTGVVGIKNVLSAMVEDAITDELVETNVVRGVRVRASDPRAKKPPRPIRTWTWQQMHAFATAGASARTSKTIRNGEMVPNKIDLWRLHYAEALLRTFSDTGMRIGEVLPLERGDLINGVFHVRRTAYEGMILQGTKTDHGEQSAGRHVPCPPGLAALIKALPSRIGTRLLFPTSTGKLWRARNFYRDVWYPAQQASGLDMRPHEMRHSYVTHLRAQGIDDADLADIAGHRVETMLATYTHPLRESFDAVRSAIG